MVMNFNENRTVTLTTKVRPVKKLFIIEPGDLNRLSEIIQCVSKEILGLFNLILINNGSLFSENMYNFIDRHNPDVVINYSCLSDTLISKKFKILSFSGDDIEKVMKSFSTPIYVVDYLPFPFTALKEPGLDRTFSCLHNEIDNLNSLNITKLLHYGYVDEELQNYLKDEIFSGIRLAPIESIDQIFDKKNILENNLLSMMLDLARFGEGSSIYHQDFNPDKYFVDEPTVIFGDKQNIESMVYFWNTRATYPRNRTVWFPIELFPVNKHLLDSFTHYCIFTRSELLDDYVKDHSIKEISPSEYYFGTYTREWETYEYLQNSSVIDGKVKVYHPFEKLPSKSGCNVNLVMEIMGIKELHVPKSSSLGGLYLDLPDEKQFRQYFARTNKLALSIFFSHFEPYSQTPVIEEIKLPEPDLIFQTIFLENDLNLCATVSSGMAKELVDVFGGVEGLDILSNDKIFELMVMMTPPRIEKLIKGISGFVDGSNKEALRNLLQKDLPSLATINSSIVVTIDEISSMVKISRDEREVIFPLIEELCQKRIILRGKYFKCPFCSTNLWFELENIKDNNRCTGCNRNVFIPNFSRNKILSDSYKLNELVTQAVDQGILPVMLTVNLLSKLPFLNKMYSYNQNIFNNEANRELLAEVDLLLILGGMLGLSEIKADRGFDNKQTDKLLNIASILNANFLIFSSLKERKSPEINNLYQYLLQKTLNIPAFIFPREALFEGRIQQFKGYFEINRETKKFYKGPIIL